MRYSNNLDDVKIVATYCTGLYSSLLITAVNDSAVQYLQPVKDGYILHTAKIYYNSKYCYFKHNGRRVSLNDCVRV